MLDYVVVSKARLAYYRERLGGLALSFVVLAPGRDVALLRDRERLEKRWPRAGLTWKPRLNASSRALACGWTIATSRRERQWP